MRQRHIVATSLFLALLAFACPAKAAVDIGQRAPELSILAFDGKLFDLSALKGKTAIVHFWATWCPSCREEMPVLASFYAKHRDEGVEVIAISTDSERHRDIVAATMNMYEFPGAMIDDAVHNGFERPNEIPVTYIIDRNGVVVGKLTPEQTKLDEFSLSRFLPATRRR